jgi:hypothetical protein
VILDEFLMLSNLAGKGFARSIGRSEAYVSKLRKFKFCPSLIESLVICHQTDWHVMPTELIQPERLNVELQIRGINPETMPRLMAV